MVLKKLLLDLIYIYCSFPPIMNPGTHLCNYRSSDAVVSDGACFKAAAAAMRVGECRWEAAVV